MVFGFSLHFPGDAFSEKAEKQAEKLKGTYKSGRYEMTNFLRRAFNIVFDMFVFEGCQDSGKKSHASSEEYIYRIIGTSLVSRIEQAFHQEKLVLFLYIA